MNIKVRSSDFIEVELPQRAGTATVVSGTGAFITSISTLRELSGNPDAIRQLVDDLEEQEYLYAMAILGSAVTGIDNTLWYIPVPGGQHGPRVKIAIDPPHAKRPGGVEATVPFDKATIGSVTPELERQVRSFIALNRQALLDYWNLNVTTDEFIARLRPIE